MTLHPAPPIHRHDPANLTACCLASAPLRGGSRVARTAPRQNATLTFGPCHVHCHCAPVPPATAPGRPPVQVAHPLPPALRERKGNHAHNGQEKRNGKQHQRQARRGDPSRRIIAAIWQNTPTDEGVFYSVHITRFFRRGLNWDRTPAFGRDDLLTVAKVTRSKLGVRGETPLHSTGDASRLSCVARRSHIRICSLLAPCQPGAALIRAGLGATRGFTTDS